MPLFEPFCGVRPCLPSGEDVLPFCENTMADLLRAPKEERRTQYETMMQKGLCAKDPQPAFYLYEEKLTLDDGAEKRALGFFALSTASVMADPLRPAILLDRDPTGQTRARLQALSRGCPRYEAHRGNRRYRLWLIDDLVMQAALRGGRGGLCAAACMAPGVFLDISRGKSVTSLCPLTGLVFMAP